jgi:hypothetical protein
MQHTKAYINFKYQLYVHGAMHCEL